MSALLEALRKVAERKRSVEEETAASASLKVKLPDDIQPAAERPSEEAHDQETAQSSGEKAAVVSPSADDAALTEIEAETLSLLLSDEGGEKASVPGRGGEERFFSSFEQASETSASESDEGLAQSSDENAAIDFSSASVEADHHARTEIEANDSPVFSSGAPVEGSAERQEHGAAGLSAEEQAEMLARREQALAEYEAHLQGGESGSADGEAQTSSLDGFEDWDISASQTAETLPETGERADAALDDDELFASSERDREDSSLDRIDDEETAQALLKGGGETPALSAPQTDDRKEKLVKALTWLGLPVLFAATLGYGAWLWRASLEEQFAQQYRRMNYERLEQTYRQKVMIAEKAAAVDENETQASDAAEKASEGASHASVRRAAERSGSDSAEDARSSALVETDLPEPNDLSVLLQPEVRIVRQVIARPQSASSRSEPASSGPARPPEPVESRIEAETELSIEMDPLSAVEESLQRNETRQAIRKLSLFLRQHPDSVQGYVFMGLAYQKLGEAAKAIYYLQKALQLDPYSQSAAEAMALTAVQFPQNGGRSILAQLFDRFPQSDVVALYYANLLEKDRKLKEAIEVLEQNLRLSPSADVYYNLAVLQIAHDRFDEARESVRQALFYMNRTPHSFQEADLLKLMQRIQPYLTQDEAS